MAGKVRADRRLVDLGLAPTGEKARAMILSGAVYMGGERVEKPGHFLPPETPLSVRGKTCPYVSRGGLKLQAALDALGVDPSGRECADIGASTGGFTDCLLSRGAARVYAVDVGRGLMDSALRANERVTLFEGVNARFLKEGDLPGTVSLATVDASFISLRLLFPAIASCLPRAEVLALVKPQFEVGRGRVGKGGVVREEAARLEALEAVCRAAEGLGYVVHGTFECPVKGPKGNVEYFVRLSRSRQ